MVTLAMLSACCETSRRISLSTNDSMASLRILQGATPGKEFELNGDRWVVGRSPECDVVLDVAAVSRRHVILSKESGDFFVQDLGSRNGTYINADRVEDRAPLRDGDKMLICDVLFEFIDTPSLLAGVRSGRVFFTWSSRQCDDDNTSTIMATIDVSKRDVSPWKSSAKPEAQLEALVEISHNLGNTLSVKEILPRILDSLFKIFTQADRGFVVMQGT